MPKKLDPDTTPGEKLLRLFRKLMLEGKRHFLVELASEFGCSAQTIIRMVEEIVKVIGLHLDTGIEHKKRWYQIKTIARNRLGLDFEELRYLCVCRDMAGSALPEQVRERVDESILNLSMLMADQAFEDRDKLQKPQFNFFSKGKIDYSKHYTNIELLLKAADDREICQVFYKASGSAEEREHLFAPGKILCMGNALYIVGATVKADSFAKIHHLTNLAVHRISRVTPINRFYSFTLPEVELNSFGLPWHEPKTFRIKFTPGKASDYIRERIWADNQKLEETADQGVILELTTRSESELLAWVRSFGREAEILE
ncbi:MAG: WYL domain-containing protein [Deltaproteobacteria bacterium]|jgi:predicted DNA-binding transcriptional regulator YafY|nr:WYL domain-containing protein [Deltaproteobacteria bacterium]